jgi:hypothetical protein
MYEYKFVELGQKGFYSSIVNPYEDIIKDHAKEGWRLVQILATEYMRNGTPSDYRIIFERPINNKEI